MQVLQKRSGDSVRFDIDCSILLGVGETITGVTSMVASPVTVPPLAFGSPNVNLTATTYTDQFGSTRTAPAGQVVQVQISGGAIPPTLTAQDFILTFTLVTSANPAVVAVVKLRLNDTPS